MRQSPERGTRSFCNPAEDPPTQEEKSMSKKFGALPIVTAALLILAAGPALANPPGGQTNGQGVTYLGGTLGVVAQADLSGNLEYHSPDGSLDVHCFGYVTYALTTTPNGTWPRSIVNAKNCWNPTKTQQYKVHAQFVDKGEPGTKDRTCLWVKTFTNGVVGDMLIKDCGVIQSGNVQIHS